MTYNEKKSLYESIMKDVAKIVKHCLNELSSTTYDDAANKASSLNNKYLERKFRNAAKDAREREKSREYDEVLDVKDTFKINGKQLIIAKYVPSNVDVLICKDELKNVCAIVRIKKDSPEPVPITDKEILKEIADILKCKVERATVMLNALKLDNQSAKKLSDRINNVLSAKVSWRAFLNNPRSNRFK